MKRYLLLLFISITTSTLFAQTNFRFADSTAQWNVLIGIGWDCNTTWCFNRKTLIHEANLDTVINGKTYQSIIVPPDSSWFTFSGLGSKVFVRKDSTEKVFLRRYNDTIDFLIYNFAKQAGDTFMISTSSNFGGNIYCDIDSVDTITLDKPRKRFFVRYNGYWYQDIWIEGIGSTKTYFLQPGTDFTGADGPVHTTICYFKNDTLAYHDANFQSCIVDTVWNTIAEVNELGISIAPNPTTNFITIQSENNFPPQTIFQVYDITGRMVLQKQLTDKTTQVELNEVSKGMYLYNITVLEKKMGSGKLVVQ